MVVIVVDTNRGKNTLFCTDEVNLLEEYCGIVVQIVAFVCKCVISEVLLDTLAAHQDTGDKYTGDCCPFLPGREKLACGCIRAECVRVCVLDVKW